MAKSPRRKVRKKSKKRAHRKSKEKRKRKRARGRSKNGDDCGALSGVGARILAVGAFAFALWFKRKQKIEASVSKPSETVSSVNTPTPNNVSTPPTSVSSQSEYSALFSIDMAGVSKPLNELNSSELRQIANSNLCRIFDEDRGGQKWEEDEVLFVR
eukprot:697241_1